MKATKNLDQLYRKPNTAQHIVVAVLVPIVIFIVSFGVMYYINDDGIGDWWPDLDPLRLGESWLGWMITFIVIGVFELIWLKDRMPRNIQKKYRHPLAVVLFLIGVFLIFDSYSPGHSWNNPFGIGSVGNSINPYEATFGVGLILCGVHWYRRRNED